MIKLKQVIIICKNNVIIIIRIATLIKSCSYIYIYIYIEKTEYNSEIQLELIDPAKKFITRPY
jgi:hypothetical protein